MFFKVQQLAYIWLCSFPMYAHLTDSTFLIKVEGQVSLNLSRLLLLNFLAKGETNYLEFCE